MSADRRQRPFLLFLVTDDRYFVSHRIGLAKAALDAGYRVGVATSYDKDAAQIDAAGIERFEIPWRRRGTTAIAEAKTIVHLARLLRRLRPDVVHNVALKPLIYGSLAARVLPEAVVVNTIAGRGFVFTQDTMRARLLRAPLRAGFRVALSHPNAKVILQNPEDREILPSSWQKRDSDIALIRGSGVDPELFTGRDPADETPTVLFASRMLWSKGIGEFHDAAVLLKEKGVRARFLAVGGTDSNFHMTVPRSQLEEWHRQGAIEWADHRADMIATFEAAHIVCLPTTYGEGVPKVLIEGAAAGRALVATDAPGCREIVRDGYNGLLVPPRDPAALAAALESLIVDRARAVEMGRRGREMVYREFSTKRVAEQTIALYERGMHARRRGRVASPSPSV